MINLCLTAHAPDLFKYREFKYRFPTRLAKPLQLSSTFEIRYLNLLNKIDKLSSVSAEGDDAEYYVAEQAANIAKSTIRKLEELKIIENNIAIHLFSNCEKGIQIELDGAGIKADIETMEDGSISLTNYTGETNNAKTNYFSSDSLDLIAEFLNIEDLIYA